MMLKSFKRGNTAAEDAIVKQAERHIRIQDEVFPPPLRQGEFATLFKMHGLEVAGRPFDLDYRRYFQLEADGRLVFVVARDDHAGPTAPAVGYSCHFWYRDLHFNERVGADDLWFVAPRYRKRGIGACLKLWGHELMRYRGCVRIRDVIRDEFDHPDLMRKIGFARRATQWTRDLAK